NEGRQIWAVGRGVMGVNRVRAQGMIIDRHFVNYSLESVIVRGRVARALRADVDGVRGRTQPIGGADAAARQIAVDIEIQIGGGSSLKGISRATGEAGEAVGATEGNRGVRINRGIARLTQRGADVSAVNSRRIIVGDTAAGFSEPPIGERRAAQNRGTKCSRG